ncbi:iron chelate uptake ABC transporter family permease subunit [Planotetraspora phitsanulokensis]|uniref:ABC transporter permease n=1 Tax=Planotetraspora phitsanulokensis TaxID=575192 RepID=A0A8J3U148_9ACTN|nr:iron ABC transporter permease [Planotetraspora phitsanulokensis]GII36355.1 ABC transporter permease [Planotetraspora phitsanulokensis]
MKTGVPSYPVAGRVVASAGPLTFVLRRRAAAVFLLLLALTAVAVVLSLGVGSTFVAPADVVRALAGDGPFTVVVQDLRLPRIVVALTVGTLLGLSGALLQAISRNPLASPDVIGVSQGAGFAATVVMSTDLGAAWLGPFALLGGLAAATLVFTLSWRYGLAARRFVLCGIAVALATKALTEIFIVGADAIDGQRAQIWLAGSVAGTGYPEARILLIPLLVLLPVLLWAGRAMDTTALDDGVARGLGVRVTQRRLLLGVVAVVLAALAISQAGAVDFVALAAAQLARRLVRAGRPPLACSAVAGALLTVVADLIARTAFAPVQLPVGVLTAVLGGPYLLWLLVRRTP